MLVLSKRNFLALNKNSFFITKKNDGLKSVKEIEADQIKQKKEDSWMGGK
jgi:hypothetical protein